MRKLVFLTGAGISAESGISTFRDSGGLWEKYPVQQVASIEGYWRDPELVIQFYNERRRQLLDVKPNRAHLLVASLQDRFETTVVTQNIDNLHEMAGSRNVIHLHGELMKAISTDNPDDLSQVVTLADLTAPGVLDKLQKKPDEIDIHMGDKANDGSQLRPYIVWFGEAVPMIEPAAEAVSKADIFVIIGTSLNVYPAAGLVAYTKKGAEIYLIDPAPNNVPSGMGIHVIQKTASEGMEELVSRLTS